MTDSQFEVLTKYLDKQLKLLESIDWKLWEIYKRAVPESEIIDDNDQTRHSS